MTETALLAFKEVILWHNLLASFVGVVLGLFVGATPGLTISLGMVLLLPLTFALGPVTSISLLLGLYAAGMTGGSISAILLDIPGTPSASATGIDGHQMAKQGKSGKAMGTAVIASFFGGIFSLVCLVLVAPQIAKIALGFGAPELFSLVFLGITLICSFAQKSIIKGLISGIFGLIVMTVGMDPMMGTPRFTFDILQLQAGISFLPAMIGLFAISQVIESIGGNKNEITEASYNEKISGLLPSLKEIKGLLKTMLLGSSLGTGIGAIPGAGGPIAVFLSYDYAKKISKTPENFGKGCLEGIAAPESANNSVAGGALIPVLTLGIPGDPITAILLGALMIQGLVPGPLLFAEHGQFVYSVFWAFLVANCMNLVVILLSIKLWVRLLKMPRNVLLPIITLLCIIGSYALRNTFFDTGIMMFFGILGYFMKKYDFPVVPMLLAIILGPAMEEHLRMSLIISSGDPTIFLRHPVSLFFLMIALISTTAPFLMRLRKKKQ
jgi:putative tricarboxylic transport membrane protein